MRETIRQEAVTLVIILVMLLGWLGLTLTVAGIFR